MDKMQVNSWGEWSVGNMPGYGEFVGDRVGAGGLPCCAAGDKHRLEWSNERG